MWDNCFVSEYLIIVILRKVKKNSSNKKITVATSYSIGKTCVKLTETNKFNFYTGCTGGSLRLYGTEPSLR